MFKVRGFLTDGLLRNQDFFSRRKRRNFAEIAEALVFISHGNSRKLCLSTELFTVKPFTDHEQVNLTPYERTKYITSFTAIFIILPNDAIVTSVPKRLISATPIGS